jgi:hypothetical protein
VYNGSLSHGYNGRKSEVGLIPKDQTKSPGGIFKDLRNSGEIIPAKDRCVIEDNNRLFKIIRR